MVRTRLFMFAVVLIGVAMFVRLATIKPPSPDKSTPAVDFSFPPNTPNLPAKLSGLQGKVVLLDLWATWCGPCRMSIPELERLYEKYKGQGLVVVGISVDKPETQSDIPQAVKDMGITYPIAVALKDIPFAKKNPEFLDNYATDSIPVLYVIDKKGNIRKQQEGYDPNLNLEDIVSDLLKE